MKPCPRVRFAPSPTGPLHIGGVRTALFNYLFAKKWGGSFILRIEDTDSNRFVPGAEEYIVESFKWVGINFDEGVGVGGNYGPYKQSERRDIYKKYVDQLLASGHAYYAFDTPEDIEALRKRLEAEKSSTLQYDALTRGSMKNSLTLSSEETQALLDSQTPYVVRIKMEPDQEIIVHDLIRGKVKVQSSIVDDKVLYKSADQLPTYHLANVVDDHLMEITHVIRGEEWLPSAPLHVTLYKYLGWEDTMPQFAHLPLLLKPDGNGKLSKRDGDRLGFPVFPLNWTDPKTGDVSKGYKEGGYFPEAVINLLAFLGWNPGTEQEIFDLNQLVENFSIERVSKHGAKFDLEKALWFNRQYLLKKTDENLVDLFLEWTKADNTGLFCKDFSNQKDLLLQIIPLVKDRLTFVSEIWTHIHYFFERPHAYDPKVIQKHWSSEIPSQLEAMLEALRATNYSALELEPAIKNFIEKNGLKMGQIMNCLRLCLVGEAKGPHLFDILAILGEEESSFRIRYACEHGVKRA